MTTEIRPVSGFPGYSVSDTGIVFGRRADTRNGLTPQPGHRGHLRVTMHRDDSPRSGERVSVHHAVLTAFVGPRPTGMEGCHRDGNPGNNALTNLYWGTPQQNWEDRRTHGRARSWSKLTDAQAIEIRRRAGNATQTALAKEFGVCRATISDVIMRRSFAEVVDAV